MVILGLQEVLGKRRYAAITTDWVLVDGAMELHITFDPRKLTVDQVLAAAQRAMERYPDPAYPGPVRLVTAP